GAEHFQDGLGGLRKRELAEDVRHLAKKASAAQARLGRRAEQNAVEAADVAVLEELQFEPFQLLHALVVGGGAEHARAMFRMHLRGHGREGEDTLDLQLARILNQLLAEGEFADRRLGLAQEHDDIVLVSRISPEKKPITRILDLLNASFLDLDVI